MSAYVESGYTISGYSVGDNATIQIDGSTAVRFFIKASSSLSKTEITTAAISKLDETGKAIGIVTDLRDGSQYTVFSTAKQAELSNGNSYVDVSGGGVSVEVINAP